MSTTLIVDVHVHRNDTLIVIRPVFGRQTVKPSGETPPNIVRQHLMLSFQNLDVYQRSIDFLAFARKLLQRIPRGHGDLIDQLRRAAQSTPQNIAEGAGKSTRADKAKHYTIARGSAMECAAHLDVLRIEELIDGESYARGIELLERVVAMLTRMIDP